MSLLPVASGEIGIFQHHAPCITYLRPGTLEIIMPDGRVLWLEISGSLVEFKDDRLALLIRDRILLACLQPAYVVLDEKRCIGCQYCVISCPFTVPQFNRGLGKSYKCNLCEHRTAEGKEPACVSTCITGALRYGKIDDLKVQGGEILASKGAEARLYGESFLKGTHVLYAIKEGPEHYGLNRDPKVPLSVIVWKQFIQPFGTYGIIGAIVAAMAHYLIIGPKKEKKYEVKNDE